MATYTDIRPLRDYDEHTVLNFIGVSGVTVNKGTFVVAQGSGINLLDNMVLDDNSWLGSVLSARFNVPQNAIPAPSGTNANRVIGMTVKSVQTFDENGLPLKFFPQKAALLDVVISGQACPIATQGFWLYSGFSTGDAAVITAGSGLGVSDDGEGSLKLIANTVSVSGVQSVNPAVVARALGPVNSQGYAMIEIKL